jgi:hypothetical protein
LKALSLVKNEGKKKACLKFKSYTGADEIIGECSITLLVYSRISSLAFVCITLRAVSY